MKSDVSRLTSSQVKSQTGFDNLGPHREHRRKMKAAIRDRLSTRMRRRFDSSDVIQDAFLSLFTRETNVPGADSSDVVRFLRKVAVNHAVDNIRAHGAEARDVTCEEPLDDNCVDPSADLIGAVMSRDYIQRLCELAKPDELRILNRFLVGDSVTEVERHCGLSRGGFRRTVNRISRRLVTPWQ